MTAAIVDRPEGVVTRDPALALKAASRDKLLTYHGFVAPAGYEVVIGGRSLVLHEDDVLGEVERLRAVETVGTAFGVTTQVTELREDGTYVIAIGSLPAVTLTADRLVDWCLGFTAAHLAREQDHIGEDQLARIARLFEQPDLNDSCRLVILGLMYGRGPDQKVTSQQLADLIGQLPGVPKTPAKKTVLDALGFGAGFASSLRELMIQVFGLRWSDVFGPLWAAVPGEDRSGDRAPLPEHPSLAVLRRIVVASKREWLRYVDEPAPNEARWNARFKVSVGENIYELEVARAHAWLDGLAFYHGS